jgi:carbonic anhydrase/acetyltransferase-like protein (isoleucine patch superfamily)
MAIIIEYNRIVPTIGKNVFIAPTAVLIGDVTIGDGARRADGTFYKYIN